MSKCIFDVGVGKAFFKKGRKIKREEVRFEHIKTEY